MLALSDKPDTTPACGDLDDGFSPVAAYEYVESFLKQNGDPAPQTPDGCVVLPLSLVLSLLPSEVLGDDAAAAAADGESVSIEVPDLYAQLAAGRVAISATALAYHVPAHLLRHEAFEEHGDEIVLPLRHVVDAVGFASLRRHCAVKRRRYANIDRLENPFKEATLSEVSVTSEPAVEQPVSDPISVDEPVSQDLAEDRPGMAVSAPQPSASEEPAEEEPVAVEPVETEPTVEEPVVAELVSEETSVVESQVDEEFAEEPVAGVSPTAPSADVVLDTAPSAPGQGEPQAAVAVDLADEFLEVLGNVNLNTADFADLMTLDGMSKALAQRILEYREANGPFETIFDLWNVPRVGRRTFRRLTGMPYSEKRCHRGRHLARLLRIPVSKVSDLDSIAEAMAGRPGFSGCVIADGEGLLLSQGGTGGLGVKLSAVTPRIVSQIRESMNAIDAGCLDSISICIDGQMLTLVSTRDVALAAIHEENRVTKTQLELIRKVGHELAWLLSHRAYVVQTPPTEDA
jgi:competence ComEA-like helix-hairpin-helix protein